MNNKIAKGRCTITFFAFTFLYAIVIANLYRIQIIQYQFFHDLASQQYSTNLTIPVARACIYDRNGIPLALNKECISACIIRSECKNKDEITLLLKNYFPQALPRFLESSSNFIFIKRRLTSQEYDNIIQSNFKEIHLIKEESRYYPLTCVGHILGITDIDNKGLFGLELQYNKQLSGSPCTVHLEKDARSGLLYFNKETKVEAHQGKEIRLTLDATLQYLVHGALVDTVTTWTAQEGAAIVLNPSNGEILALAQVPNFDPNNTLKLDMSSTKNRVLTERHELGSVIKVFAAGAALEEGLVTNDEMIDCKNKESAYICGRKINTPHADGIIPFWNVIASSNNIGTATVALRLGPKLYDHYVRLGFTTSLGIDFPGAQIGFVNHPDSWSKQSIISLSYGYEIAITLMHLARAFGIIANDGFMVYPRLIMDDAQITRHKRVYSQKTVANIQEILEKTTTQGTARRAQIKGYRIMCKTGTANTLLNGVYNKDINLFTCSGIVQKDNFKRVIVVFIKTEGKKHRYASRVAVPLFETVAEKILIHDRVI